jgi:hypothetical protein
LADQIFVILDWIKVQVTRESFSCGVVPAFSRPYTDPISTYFLVAK